jgi:hypothetical protein
MNEERTRWVYGGWGRKYERRNKHLEKRDSKKS